MIEATGPTNRAAHAFGLAPAVPRPVSAWWQASSQLRHSDLGITTHCTAGLNPQEVTAVSASRPLPAMPVLDLVEALSPR